MHISSIHFVNPLFITNSSPLQAKHTNIREFNLYWSDPHRRDTGMSADDIKSGAGAPNTTPKLEIFTNGYTLKCDVYV